MKAPITYVPGFISDPKAAFDELWHDLAWKRSDLPRREYYCNDFAVDYTYGNPAYPHTYSPQPWHPRILAIRKAVEDYVMAKMDVCFLNGYETSRDQLGWHSDDSPEMDDARPIVIVTFGAEREIWFAPIGDKSNPEKLKLEDGSMCVMEPGMQDTHLHRIPKAGFECGPRISLTFRGFVPTICPHCLGTGNDQGGLLCCRMCAGRGYLT